MPRKTPSKSPPEPEQVIITAEEADQEDRIAVVRASLGGQDAYVKLYLVPPGKPNVFLDRLTVEQADEVFVRDRYGAGRYIAKFYHSDNTYAAQVTFDVAGPLGGTSSPPSPAVPGGAAPEDPIRQLAAVLLLREMRAVQNPAAAPASAVDPMKVGLDIAKQIAALSAAMVQGMGSGGGGSMKDQLGFATELVKLGKELVTEGGGGGMDPADAVITKLAEPVGRILEAQLTKGGKVEKPEQPPAQLTPGGGGPASEPPQFTAARGFTGPSWLLHLRPFLPTLTQWARAGKDPELRAALVLDEVPQGVYDELEAAAASPSFVEDALQGLAQTPLAPFPAWCKAVLEEMRESLTEPAPGTGGEETGGAASG